MSLKKHLFHAVIIIQGLILLFLALSQIVPYDIVSFPYAWFYNSNEQILVTKENKSHVCMPINPKLPTENVFLMIIVKSRSLTEDKREAIRETWAKNFQDRTDVYLTFVIGCTRSIHLDRDVNREAKHQRDILRLPSYEDEKGYNIRRIQHAYRVASQYKPKYMITTQDDVYIHMPKLLSWLNGRQDTDSLYAGRILRDVKVIRDMQSKLYLSEKEYPQEKFPDYCSGVIYILSGDLVMKIVAVQKEIPVFNIEDAYIGVVVSKLRVEPTDISVTVARISDNTPHELQSWKSEVYQEHFIIGYNLLPNMMQYIQDRFNKIEKS